MKRGAGHVLGAQSLDYFRIFNVFFFGVTVIAIESIEYNPSSLQMVMDTITQSELLNFYLFYPFGYLLDPEPGWHVRKHLSRARTREFIFLFFRQEVLVDGAWG